MSRPHFITFCTADAKQALNPRCPGKTFGQLRRNFQSEMNELHRHLHYIGHSNIPSWDDEFIPIIIIDHTTRQPTDRPAGQPTGADAGKTFMPSRTRRKWDMFSSLWVFSFRLGNIKNLITKCIRMWWVHGVLPNAGLQAKKFNRKWNTLWDGVWDRYGLRFCLGWAGSNDHQMPNCSPLLQFYTFNTLSDPEIFPNWWII